MPVALYLDHNVPRAVRDGLRLRGIDVVTCFEDNTATLPDPALLDRASGLRRVLVSQDRDLLVEAQRRQLAGAAFSGLIYSHPQRIALGQFITDLELTAQACELKDLSGRVLFLPI